MSWSRFFIAWSEFLRWFWRLYVRFAYRLEIHGLENLPDGPMIITPNHESQADGPLLLGIFRFRVVFLARAEIFNWLIIGPIVRWLGYVPVRRGDGISGREAKDRIVDQITSSGIPTVVYPQGHCSPDGQLRRADFRTGAVSMALAAKVPLVPMATYGSRQVWPLGIGKKPRSIRHIISHLPRLWGRIIVVIGQPIMPDPDSKIHKVVDSLYEEMQLCHTLASQYDAMHKFPENFAE